MSKTDACSWISVYTSLQLLENGVGVEVLLLDGLCACPAPPGLLVLVLLHHFLAQQQEVLGGTDTGWLWLLGVLPVLSVLGVLTLVKPLSMALGFWLLKSLYTPPLVTSLVDSSVLCMWLSLIHI